MMLFCRDIEKIAILILLQHNGRYFEKQPLFWKYIIFSKKTFSVKKGFKPRRQPRLNESI